MAYDFLIAGGGIGGAVLAKLLTAAGRRVLVLEKNLNPVHRARPEVLWPVTVDRLKTLIPPEREAEWMTVLLGITASYRGKTLAQVTPQTFEHIGVRMVSTDPNRSRALLLEAAGCEVRRGVEVAGLIKEGNRVVGVRSRETANGKETEIPARWVVGDDGGQSLVRRETGIALAARFLPLEILTFGCEWPASLPERTVRLWLNPDRARTGIFVVGAIPWPRGLGAALIPARPDVLDRTEQFAADLRQFTSQDPALAELLRDRVYPRDFVRVRIAWGHAEKYGVDGAVLMGDALHPVSPAGGQGANMSVADAYALAEAAATHDGLHLVSEYERRRRSANERSLLLTRRLSQVLSLPGWIAWCLSRAAPSLLRWIGRRPERIGRALRFAATAFVE